MATLFGKEIKSFTEITWNVVPKSVKKFTAKMLENVTEIKVRYSEKYDHYYATIYLKNGCVSWQLDYKFQGNVGDTIIPETFRVYQLTNGEKVITRCTGKVYQLPAEEDE